MLARLSRAERLFTYAQKLSAHGKMAEAIEAFEAAHTLSPTHIGVCLYWALALSEMGCHDDAWEVMQRATKLQPTRSVLHLFLGQICFDREDYPTAKTYFQNALNDDPFNVHTQAFLALIDLIQGHIQKSYQCLTRPIPIPAGTIEQAICRFGLSQPPSTLQLVSVALQSRILLTIETYFCQHQLSPRSLSQQLVDLQQTQPPHIPARCLATLDALLTHGVLGAKRLVVALRYLLDRKSRIEALRHSAADEAYYLCQTSQAIAAYQNLLERHPESLLMKQRLFDLLYESGDFDHALTCFQELTRYGTSQHQPTPLECMYLGELLYLAGKTKEGRRYLDQAATSPISEFKLHYFIGLDEVRARRKTNARHHFAQALRILNPDICLLRLQELNRIHPGVALKQPIDRTCSTISGNP